MFLDMNSAERETEIKKHLKELADLFGIDFSKCDVELHFNVLDNEDLQDERII